MSTIEYNERLAAFANPSAIYRPAPLWVWNDDMQPQQIRFQLQELASHGFGGAFVHPRPGLVTPYLSEAWFARWEEALEEASRLGLKLYIYDENSYPSGFAGGHVPSELPDCLANSVLFHDYDVEQLKRKRGPSSIMLNRPGHPIKAFAVRAGEDGHSPWEVVQEVTRLPVSEWPSYGERFWVFELGTPETNNWLGGFAYADLLRPEVTQRFLETTHEQYRRHFGDRFGSQIPALFTDEPEISPGNLFEAGTPLPYTYWFAGEFERLNGYDLRDYLPCLFHDVVMPSDYPVEPEKVRYDYFCTIRSLWVNNSIRPISEWCEQQGIAFTGHYLEHQWPHPFHRTSPAVMSLYEYMHWPAIDFLETKLLRPKPASPEAPEPTSYDQLNHDPVAMLTVREAQSAANQFGRERVLCESYGAGGWDSTFEDYKRIGDWLYVHGINFMNQHLTYGTIAGARKRDHPQSFDWRQPWWDEYTELNHYYARLSYALSQGRSINRIAVLNPTTSSFLVTAETVASCPVYRAGIDATLELIQALSEGQWDFDLCDEFIMERHGSVEDAALRVGQARYEVLVIPAAVTHLKRSTVDLLSRFLDAGGTVLAAADPPELVEGCRSGEAARLQRQSGWHKASDTAQLLDRLSDTWTPRLVWTAARGDAPGGMAHLRRDLGDGSAFYFVVNSGKRRSTGTLTIAGEQVEQWHPFDGTVTYPEQRPGEGGTVSLDMKLEGSGSVLLRVLVHAEPLAPAAVQAGTGLPIEPQEEIVLPPATDLMRQPLATSDWSILPERDNVLPLLHCDLTAGTKRYEGLFTVHASRYAFEHHGFETNPWDNAVQFKSRLLDRNRAWDARSGIVAEYHLEIAELEGVGPVRLELERPELYRISVNGIACPAAAEGSRLDHHMGSLDIRDALQSGRNTIRLEGRPFSIFMELEPIYIFGAFSVIPGEQGWQLARERAAALGSWRECGYPFYSDAMRYRHTFQAPDADACIVVSIPSWQGAVISVSVDGVQAGLIGVDHGHELEITPHIRPGVHHMVDYRVSGTWRNLMGPHLDHEKLRNTAWPGAWKRSPLAGPPPASDYDLLDYGLLGDVELYLLTP
ncbi:glycosyl hydrolase [Paenibacillus sp. 1P07SE]|uniref:glycosyl hydrolase n=1 Tax=Paenibacillus sp. 1P07SE TaxID=3132209 RepID=UPI0039A592C2